MTSDVVFRLLLKKDSRWVLFLDPLTIDESTLQTIPIHLRRMLNFGMTNTESMNILVVALALETGFVIDRYSDDFETYQLNWSYSFDRKMLDDFSKIPEQLKKDLDEDMTLKFKLSSRPEKQISVQTISCGDIFTVTGFLVGSSSIISARTIALSMSRYVIQRKLNSKLSKNFRFLRELSIKMKNAVFLPLRNEIFHELSLKTPYPSFQGLGDDSLLYIFRFLTKKEIANVASTCKSLRCIAFPLLCRNKSKTS